MAVLPEDLAEVKGHGDALIAQGQTYAASCIKDGYHHYQFVFQLQTEVSQQISAYEAGAIDKHSVITQFNQRTLSLSMTGGCFTSVKEPNLNMQSQHTTSSINKDLSLFNDNVVTPAGIIGGGIEQLGKKLHQDRWRFRKTLLNYGKLADDARLVGNYTFFLGLFITAGTTFYDEYAMYQQGASAEDLAFRAIDGIVDISVGALPFILGPESLVGVALYYVADQLVGGNLAKSLYNGGKWVIDETEGVIGDTEMVIKEGVLYIQQASRFLNRGEELWDEAQMIFGNGWK